MGAHPRTLLEHLDLPHAAAVTQDWLDRAARDSLGYADCLGGVLEEEVVARQRADTERRLRAAGFPYAASIEQFDFRFRPELKRQVVLRYLDPGDDERMVDPELERYWMGPREPGDTGGVDLYVGGVEHAVLHLLYARFWHKVLHDLGHVSSEEPFRRLVNQGYISAFAYTDERGFYVPGSAPAPSYDPPSP